MNTLIFRTIAPFLTALMLLFSVFILLRGHNEPGGGFIGGLIAASALAIYGIAFGVGAVRLAIRFHPMAIAGCGLLVATLSGFASILAGTPFMTGLWITPTVFNVDVPLSTVMSFDLGVYLVVLGAITSIALALEQDTGEQDAGEQNADEGGALRVRPAVPGPQTAADPAPAPESAAQKRRRGGRKPRKEA